MFGRVHVNNTGAGMRTVALPVASSSATHEARVPGWWRQRVGIHAVLHKMAVLATAIANVRRLRGLLSPPTGMFSH